MIIALVAMAGMTGLSDFSGNLCSTFDNVSCGAVGGIYHSHVPPVPAFGFYNFDWVWQNADGSGCLRSVSWSMDPPPPSGGCK